MTAQELYQIVRKEIDVRASTDPVYRTIQKKIDDQKADFNDTARLSRLLSQILGEKLAKHILKLPPDEGRSELCQQLLKDFFDEINHKLAQVQRSQDQKNGISLNPVQPSFPTERVQNVAGSLNDTTEPDSTIQRRCRNAVSNVANAMHDSFIQENAKFRNDAGLQVTITRTGGADCCEWCAEVSGSFTGYNRELKEVFRRHDNCTCTITYTSSKTRSRLVGESDGAGGTTSKWVESRKSWQEKPILPDVRPTRFTQEQAKRFETEQLRKQGFVRDGDGIRLISSDLTNGGNGGRISTGGKITDRNFMYYENFEKQARSFYDARVKGGDSDVKSIAENTGFDYENVLAIKKHLMEEEHLFKDGTIRKFDPSIDIALAWQRLMKGEQQEIEILLLNHELRELRYIQKTGCDYETAHNYSNQKYDWESAIPLFNETDSIDTSLL